MEYGEFYKSFDPAPLCRENSWFISGGEVGGKGRGCIVAG